MQRKKSWQKQILFIFFHFWSLVEIENTEFEIKKKSIHTYWWKNMNITVLLSNFCPWPGCINTVSLSAVHVLLSWFYLDKLTSSRFYHNFCKNMDKIWVNFLYKFYPNLIQICRNSLYPDFHLFFGKIKIKSG